MTAKKEESGRGIDVTNMSPEERREFNRKMVQKNKYALRRGIKSQGSQLGVLGGATPVVSTKHIPSNFTEQQ